MTLREHIVTTVTDIITRVRSVKIPSACPQCGASLTAKSALQVWEYQDQSRFAEFESACLNSGLGDLPDSGESYIGPIEISCAECGFSLARNREVHLSIAQAKHPYIQRLLAVPRKKKT